ncbi:MAG: hypothetical protein KDC95_16045, partial [Planctomycetes bacterium]|nr:hypothetical protein [Planctomycetota bacterium]
FTIEDPRAQIFEVRVADENDRLWFFRSIGRVFALNLPACDARISAFVHPRRSARKRIPLGDEPRHVSMQLR